MINIQSYFPVNYNNLYKKNSNFDNFSKMIESFQEVTDEFIKNDLGRLYDMDLKSSYMSDFLNLKQLGFNFLESDNFKKLFDKIYLLNKFLINKKNNNINSINDFLKQFGINLKIIDGKNEVIISNQLPKTVDFDKSFDFYFDETFTANVDTMFSQELSFEFFPKESYENVLITNFLFTYLRKIIPATSYIRIA
jgi:hypothetical protein